MITLLLALAVLMAVVYAAGKWAETKQRRLAAGVAADADLEVRHGRDHR